MHFTGEQPYKPKNPVNTIAAMFAQKMNQHLDDKTIEKKIQDEELAVKE